MAKTNAKHRRSLRSLSECSTKSQFPIWCEESTAPLSAIRGGYGKGFKLPSLASLGDPIIGNPDLKPETSTGWDLGLEYHTPNNEFIATIEYFHNRFNKLIDLDPDLLNQGMFQLTKLDEALTKGMEFF
jgi:outer membrane cobalamin receptor